MWVLIVPLRKGPSHLRDRLGPERCSQIERVVIHELIEVAKPACETNREKNSFLSWGGEVVTPQMGGKEDFAGFLA